MTKEELQKLTENLEKELMLIDKELTEIATENPLVRGDFLVKIEDIGSSQEDAALEAGDLDRSQALVDTLVQRRKEIVIILDKIKGGTYGQCENCSVEINQARLRAVPIASLCIACARKMPV